MNLSIQIMDNLIIHGNFYLCSCNIDIDVYNTLINISNQLGKKSYKVKLYNYLPINKSVIIDRNVSQYTINNEELLDVLDKYLQLSEYRLKILNQLNTRYIPKDLENDSFQPIVVIFNDIESFLDTKYTDQTAIIANLHKLMTFSPYTNIFICLAQNGRMSTIRRTLEYIQNKIGIGNDWDAYALEKIFQYDTYYLALENVNNIDFWSANVSSQFEMPKNNFNQPAILKCNNEMNLRVVDLEKIPIY